MKPPPLPFYSGATLRAGDSGAMLVLTRPSNEAFAQPASTTALYLPRAKLVHVCTFAYRRRCREASADNLASLHFFGHFADVARPRYVKLEPVSAVDAVAFSDLLKKRLDLPRKPVIVSADELDDRVPSGSFVVAKGQYNATFERPNFGRVRLGGSFFHELEQRGLREGTYTVAGFYWRPGPSAEPLPGYRGPCVDVVDLDAVQGAAGKASDVRS